MEKRDFRTIAEKKRTVTNIIRETLARDSFLLLGHQDPDTDCIASLAAFALLLRKFQKEVHIYLPGPISAQFSYLLAICKYNGVVTIYGKDPIPGIIDAIVILDTPKPEMIALNSSVKALMDNPGVRKMEVDHHLEADAAYAGERDFALVASASSSCELIGYFGLKMARQANLQWEDLFSRNIALALLIGIVDDSRMGKYLKSDRERWYYRLFTGIFERLLVEKDDDRKVNRLDSMEGLFDVIQRFSVVEKRCYERILGQKNASPSISYVILDEKESADLFTHYDTDLIINVVKAAADTLAEESGKMGLLIYYDLPGVSNFIQFRMRRSSRYAELDLRLVLVKLGIPNGGGHPGAIGFRINQEDAGDIGQFVKSMVDQIEAMVE